MENDVSKVSMYQKQMNDIKVKLNQTGVDKDIKTKLEAEYKQISDQLQAELNGTSKSVNGDSCDDSKFNPFKNNEDLNSFYSDSQSKLSEYNTRLENVNKSIEDIKKDISACKKDLESGDLKEEGKVKIEKQLKNLENLLVTAQNNKTAIENGLNKLKQNGNKYSLIEPPDYNLETIK